MPSSIRSANQSSLKNATYQPYPFDIVDPEGEVQTMFMEKIKQGE
jgi:capsid protein